MGLQQVIIGEGAVHLRGLTTSWSIRSPTTCSGSSSGSARSIRRRTRSSSKDYKAKFKEIPDQVLGRRLPDRLHPRAGDPESRVDRRRQDQGRIEDHQLRRPHGNYKFDDKGQAYNFNMYIVANVNKGQNVVREVVKIPKQ
jgi:hypothetical protein